MLSRRLRAKLYILLTRYKQDQKLFHKKKLAVGLIKFRYVYQLHDGFILSESFEPNLASPQEKYESASVEVQTTKSLYEVSYRDLLICLIILVISTLVPIKLNSYILDLVGSDGLGLDSINLLLIVINESLQVL